MIKSIVIEGFKSLEKVELQLGNLNLFIGTNASGKSNFLDALRVLQGIGYGFRIDEILNGKPKSANSDVWDGIRGGSELAIFAPRNSVQGSQQEHLIKLSVEFLSLETKTSVIYSVSFSTGLGGIRAEALYQGDYCVFDSKRCVVPEDDQYYKTRYSPHLENSLYSTAQSRLHQLVEFNTLRERIFSLQDLEIIARWQHHLGDMQNLDFAPAILRGYSTAVLTKRLGERGENFAALVYEIVSSPPLKEAYLSWLQQLSPENIDEVVIKRGALAEPMFALRDGQRERLAPILSDGTLRFAALAAALLQPDMPQRLLLEEIETGIHPSRLRLLVELLENRSKDVQIFATTHSPYVLAWLDQSHYAHTFIFKRDEETGATKVVPLTEVPHLMELLEKKQPLSDLFAEGWLESVL